MSFLKNIFSKKDEPVKNNAEFWEWFRKHERTFFHVIRTGNDIEEKFFNKLSPKLDELKSGYFFLTGMCDEHTAELVITPDGAIRNIVFVEELVAAAPVIPGWKFTALKPALDIESVRITMGDYSFDRDTLSFYSNDLKDYPDEIDITVIHRDYTEENKSTITNGTYIFIDNYIGELDSVTTIDNLIVAGKAEAGKELVPIGKLKAFLTWRQKEFIEKYEGVVPDGEDATHSVLEAELENGNKLVATVNTDILNWENKASHPWILCVGITFDGSASNGMPDKETYTRLDDIEERIVQDLSEKDGYINIGRQTADGLRNIYFACKDFRKPSRVLHAITLEHQGEQITYDIYKDKYWRSLDRFNPSY
ncbi:MAG TPA: DUF695 domain-containing protein [Ohtaekwangia sp.]